MKSQLTTDKFERKLQELTSPEKELFFLFPYNTSGTPFCGTFDNSTFDLTRNSFLISVKWFPIKGEYKRSENNSTEVTFKVELAKEIRVFMIGALVFGLIGVNTILFYFRDSIKISVFLTLNGFLILGCLWVLVVNTVIRKLVEERFRTAFEVVD